jgi:hypothetical protein
VVDTSDGAVNFRERDRTGGIIDGLPERRAQARPAVLGGEAERVLFKRVGSEGRASCYIEPRRARPLGEAGCDQDCSHSASSDYKTMACRRDADVRRSTFRK